jgi:hypothetical protein
MILAAGGDMKDLQDRRAIRLEPQLMAPAVGEPGEGMVAFEMGRNELEARRLAAVAVVATVDEDELRPFERNEHPRAVDGRRRPLDPARGRDRLGIAPAPAFRLRRGEVEKAHRPAIPIGRRLSEIGRRSGKCGGFARAREGGAWRAPSLPVIPAEAGIHEPGRPEPDAAVSMDPGSSPG